MSIYRAKHHKKYFRRRSFSEIMDGPLTGFNAFLAILFTAAYLFPFVWFGLLAP